MLFHLVSRATNPGRLYLIQLTKLASVKIKCLRRRVSVRGGAYAGTSRTAWCIHWINWDASRILESAGHLRRCHFAHTFIHFAKINTTQRGPLCDEAKMHFGPSWNGTFAPANSEQLLSGANFSPHGNCRGEWKKNSWRRLRVLCFLERCSGVVLESEPRRTSFVGRSNCFGTFSRILCVAFKAHTFCIK